MKRMMDEKVKELTLLLLYLTSWEDDEDFVTLKKSWKSYPFHILDDLKEADFIKGSNKSKSVYLTKGGVQQAEKLVEKYFVRLER
ncbi:DUF6429 family protein [Solibacillus sp. FSL W8-0474]|uniref:DUF6429 family protein n=1 Tax=Solibacillus sp. FSL W8-0474 TaxID=2975336 RepID=UPI0030F5EB54